MKRRDLKTYVFESKLHGLLLGAGIVLLISAWIQSKAPAIIIGLLFIVISFGILVVNTRREKEYKEFVKYEDLQI
ncbi:MAG: FtsH-binding integral membrane protein [Candidatus Woesearchaeota archaeon]|jgi:FtsH-binding integral membrane protein